MQDTAKCCQSCGLSKTLDEFYKHPGSQDGRKTTCRPCYISRQLSYREVPSNGQYRRQTEVWTRTCTECQRSYVATSNKQRRCFDCTNRTDCRGCGELLPADWGWRKYCSKQCGAKAHYRRKLIREGHRCLDCGKPVEMSQKKGSLPVPTCRECRNKKCPECGSSMVGPGRCASCLTQKGRQWKRHGLEVSEMNAILKEQGGVCALCGEDDPVGGWQIDHDHSCCPGKDSCGGCVRGILCIKCNTGLGQLGDTVESLKRALWYLVNAKR